MAVTVEIKGNKCIITMDANDLKKLPESSTGKSLMIASTGGFQMVDAKVNGKNVTVNAMVSIKK